MDPSLELQITCLGGATVNLSVPREASALELRRLLSSELPLKAGATLALYHEDARLLWGGSLGLLGNLGEEVSLTGIYLPSDVQAAWRYLQGLPEEGEEVSLEGIQRIHGIVFEEQLVDLPSTLQCLTFASSFNHTFAGLPDTLQELTFGYRFNKRLAVLPASLQSLTFGDDFNESLEGLSLPALRSLTFGQHFDQTLEGILPESLESLTLGYDFNQGLMLKHLVQLKRLVLGPCFSQPLRELPRSLEALTLGEAFFPSSGLDLDLPALRQLVCPNMDLTSLKPLTKLDTLAVGLCSELILPASLRDLTMRSPGHVDLPSGLQSLTLEDDGVWHGWRSLALPSGLRSLTCSRHCGTLPALPENLETLHLGGAFNETLPLTWPGLQSLSLGVDFDRSLVHMEFPSTLTSLTFSYRFDQPLVNLPPNLQSLTLGFCFQQALQHVTWPESLRHLVLGDLFDEPMEGMQWPMLESLSFGQRFNQSMEAANLPQSLQELKFGDAFNQSLGVLPESLEVLVFGRYFNQSLHATDLPDTLKTLSFGLAFDQIHSIRWPASLRDLSLEHVEELELPRSLQRLSSGGLTTEAL